MKTTVAELLTIKQGLLEILNFPVSSSAIAFRVQNNVRKIDDELKTYMEMSGKLAKEYLKKDEEGKPIQLENGGFMLDEETAMEYHKKNSEMKEEECEIELGRFTFNDLDKFEEPLTASIVYLIESLIDESPVDSDSK